MVKKIIMAITSGISILSLAFVESFPISIKILIAIVGVGCILFLIYNEIKDSRGNERVCQTNEEIMDTMMRLIKSDGKVAILSRDLSWVNEDIKFQMAKKANNIVLCVQKENKLTLELEDEGVVIRYYGHLGFEPVSRFTIIRYNKEEAQVAIANTESSVRTNTSFKHVIYQTSPHGNRQDEWINSLSKDLIKLCFKAGRNSGQSEN